MTGLRWLLALCFSASVAVGDPVRTAEACALFLRPLAMSAYQQKFKFPIPLHIHGKELNRPYLALGKIENFYEPEALYIGVSNHMGADGFHHYYLVTGNRRFDASPGKPGKIHDNKSGSAPLVTKGVVFKLKLPPEALAKIRADMEASVGTEYATCLHAVLEILDKNGISIAPDAEGKNQISTAQISTGLLSGQATWNGNPIPVEFFASDPIQILPFLTNAMNMDAIVRARLEAQE